MSISGVYYLRVHYDPMRDPGDDKQETLDPEDWESMRALGHRVIDDAIDYLRDVADRPAWQPVPKDVSNQLTEALPRQPSDPALVYEQFQQTIFPYQLIT